MYFQKYNEAEALRSAHSLIDRPAMVWFDGNAALDSAGRWSYLGSDPVEICAPGTSGRATWPPLDQARTDAGPFAHVPRWAGFVSYDAVLESPAAGSVWFGRYPAMLAIDRESNEAWLVGDDADACAALQRRLETGRRTGRRPPETSARVGPPEAEPVDRHLQAIGRALEDIGAGRIYEVNLARRWLASFEGEPLTLWQAMRETSPVPFGFFLRLDRRAILARTMETFLHWDRSTGQLTSRPIKGTRAREGRDREEAERLRTDDKERAEHSMVVDVVRNDFGRIAHTGTVRVDQVMAVETYRGLHHLVSTISCTPRPALGLFELLQATFPPASITGAPKLEAAKVIAELERRPRGVYTGTVGYLDRGGGVNFAVAIRTAQIENDQVSYYAGGGIVSASVPAREVEETELKARVFLDAIRSLRG